MADAPQNRYWLEEFLDRCQTLVGLMNAASTALVIDVRTLLDAVPAAISASEELLVRRMFGLLLGRFVRVVELDNVSEVADAFVEFAAADPGPERWRADVLWFVEVVSRAVRQRRRNVGGGLADPRVMIAVQYIEQYCCDPHLRLRDVAQYVRLSPSHVVRRLRSQTGLGFTGHLHRARLAQAKAALELTAATIKEIAVSVGYETSSQFGRRFKRHVGATPQAYRRRVQTNLAGEPSTVMRANQKLTTNRKN
jgi:AraC-like DNA-binding protein